MTAQAFCDLLTSFGDNPYEVDGVDLLAHSLQCAGMAMDADADDDVVLAAALHDIGRSPQIRRDQPDLPHEASGADLVLSIAGPRAAWLVGTHVAAKRYLVAADPHYASTLSPVSIRTLEQQGGPFSPDEAAKFREHQWWELALTLRRWDDAAKVPGVETPSIDDVTQVYVRYSNSRTAQGTESSSPP